jgi:hypothetical protein
MSASPIDARSLTTATTTSADAAREAVVDSEIPQVRWSRQQPDHRSARRPGARAQTPTLATVLGILGAGCAATAWRMGMLMGRPPFTARSTSRDVAPSKAKGRSGRWASDRPRKRLSHG